MRNWDDPGAARQYHEGTKHSFESVRSGGHRLDWENRPNPFKDYVGLTPLSLPAGLALDRLLPLGAGVVRSRTLPGGDRYHFRTYASAGALYPIEVYLASATLPGLEAGLYHFHPRELALRRLRAGDYRAFLADASAAPEVADAGAVLVLTGTLWRTAWKYGARGYRHLWWDAGTMLANLFALASSASLGPHLLTAFVDTDVNLLLGVDGRREMALVLLAVGRAERASGRDDPEPLDLQAAPLSRRERAYPEAEAFHAASSLGTPEEVRRYRKGAQEPVTLGGDGDLTGGEPLEAVIRRRGSARNFTLEPVPAPRLTAILGAASAPLAADLPRTNEIHLIANAVEGIEPGAYRFRPPDGFDLVKAGNFRGWAGYLALEQEHAARAAATQFLTAELEPVLRALGNRGYRAAQLEAGIRAGRLYLGAYARGLGATGLTFYDDEVGRFFTGDTRTSPMLCVALGPDARRRRS